MWRQKISYGKFSKVLTLHRAIARVPGQTYVGQCSWYPPAYIWLGAQANRAMINSVTSSVVLWMQRHWNYFQSLWLQPCLFIMNLICSLDREERVDKGTKINSFRLLCQLSDDSLIFHKQVRSATVTQGKQVCLATSLGLYCYSLEQGEEACLVWKKGKRTQVQRLHTTDPIRMYEISVQLNIPM